MPFKKRKEEKALRIKELADSRLQTENKFDAAIEAADQITDPAKKVLALRKIQQEITSAISAENNAINKKSSRSASTLSGAGLGVVIGGTAAVTIATGGVGLLVALPLLAADMIAGGMRQGSVEKKLKAALGGHVERMAGQRARVAVRMNTVVKNNVAAISQSPLYGQVLALPGLADTFADAAAKHITDAKALAAEKAVEQAAAPPVKAATPKAPPAKKKPADFGRITKVGE